MPRAIALSLVAAALLAAVLWFTMPALRAGPVGFPRNPTILAADLPAIVGEISRINLRLRRLEQRLERSNLDVATLRRDLTRRTAELLEATRRVNILLGEQAPNKPRGEP